MVEAAINHQYGCVCINVRLRQQAHIASYAQFEAVAHHVDVRGERFLFEAIEL